MLLAYGYKQIAFADPLKAALASLGFKEPPTRAEKEAPIPGWGFSYREAAQTLGTEWARGLQDGFWLRIAAQRIQGLTVISDVRFEDEAAFVRSTGVVVHIAGRPTSVTGDAAKHVSEQGVEWHPGDVRLDNRGDLVALQARVKHMMENL
jgi:hypothetical protein